MAVDTRNKRFSMMGLFQPVPALLPDPDGAIGTQDRAMLINLYHGLTLEISLFVQTFGLNARIDQYGQGVIAEIAAQGQGVNGNIVGNFGVYAIIDSDGQGISGEIDGFGQGVSG